MMKSYFFYSVASRNHLPAFLKHNLPLGSFGNNLPQIGFRFQKNSINVKLFSIGVEYDIYNIIGDASMFSLYFKKS